MECVVVRLRVDESLRIIKKKEDKLINGNLKWPLHEKMIKAFSFPLNNSLHFDKGWPEDKQDSFASKLQTWNFAFWC